MSWALVSACGDDKPGGNESTGGATTGTEEGTVSSTEPGTGASTSEPTDTVVPTGTGETTGESTGGFDPEVVQRCNDHEVEDDLLTEKLCECSVAAMYYPDQASCLAMVDQSPDPQRNACACEVYGGYAGAADVYACLAPARAAALACSQGVSCAEDPTALDECLGTYYLAVENCPHVPVGALAEAASVCDMIAAFECGSGESIPGDWKCNFLADCADMSDEIGCPGSFMCADGSQWLPDEYRCDYFADCDDGSDELGCPDFMCTSGESIPPEQVCDEMIDCDDGSDESGCPGDP